MQTGQAISGIAHVAIIGFVLLRGMFSVDTPPVQVSEVALVTAEEYAALSAPQQAPEAETAPSALTEPEATEPEEPPAPEVTEEAPPERQDPTPPPPPQAEAEVPPAPTPPQPPAPEVAEELPEAPQPPEPPSESTAALIPQEPRPDQRPQPRPVEREAATPAPPPPPDARPDPVTEAPQEPEGQQQEAPEAETAAAPEEATDTPPEPEAEPVEEPAVPAPATGAPTVSKRPATRPSRPQPAPQPEQTRTATETQQAPAQDTERSQAVDDAVAAALGQAGASQPAPSGPPLTGGEQEALRLAVSQCWSVGSLSSAALATTVVVGVSMTPDGRPQTNSIRLVSWSGGDQSAAQQAFDAARRAIIRCGQQGYPLPTEKYEQWRDIEMTFNPEKMQYR